MTTDCGVARMRVFGVARQSVAAPGVRIGRFAGCFLFVAVLAFVFGPVSANATYLAPESIDGATTVTSGELIEMAATMNDLVVIDARNLSDWEDGHIDGAVHIANTEMTEESLVAVVKRDQPVVFYCNGPKCYRSGDASIKAVEWGWRNVYWFRGGIEEWTAKRFPLTK